MFFPTISLARRKVAQEGERLSVPKTSEKKTSEQKKSEQKKSEQKTSDSKLADQKVAEPASDWTYVEKRLSKARFNRSFISEMKRLYEPDRFMEVLKLNVLLYLRKTDYHGPQVTPQAEREVRDFLAANQTNLKKAEREHKVPASIVASLLWIESRHGRNVGQFHVPSVFIHLVQAERNQVARFLRQEARTFASDVTDQQVNEIKGRTRKKAEWALSELRALEKIHRWKWEIGRDFRGSFSGAFGMAQFLPSSYMRWARSARPPAQPNLSQADDAIQSVAYYLRDHGWRKKSATHMNALLKYNNSRDYANAILTLARQVEQAEQKKGASPKVSSL